MPKRIAPYGWRSLSHAQNTFQSTPWFILWGTSGELARRRAVSLGKAVRDYPEDKTLINSHMRECFSKVVVDFLSGDLVFHWKHGGEPSRLLYKVPAFEG